MQNLSILTQNSSILMEIATEETDERNHNRDKVWEFPELQELHDGLIDSG